MSLMEKRLQLLLDAHRWELVSRAAADGHRSAASVIREAIDSYFSGAAEDERRQEAARRFLERTAEPAYDEPGLGPEEIGAALDDDLATYLDKKLAP